MSNTKNSRSYNASPVPVQESLLSFLEPGSKPIINAISTFSRREQSPKCASKSNKSTRVSPVLSCNIASRLEFAEKQNLLLNERNKVLIKEKDQLQKKITKESQNPKNVFKNQAVALTKESYLKRVEKKNSRKLSDFEEKVPQIRKILNWVNEQNPDIEIKFIKPGIQEVIEKLKGLEIEIEAYRACMLKHSDKQVKVLEDKIEELSHKRVEDTSDTLSILLKKNNDLCRINYSLDKKIDEQNKIILTLSNEMSKLRKPESQSAILEGFKKDIEKQVKINKRQQDEEVIISLMELEKEHLQTKELIKKMDEEIKQKDGRICELNKEINDCKVRVLEMSKKLANKRARNKSLKRKYEDKVQINMVDKELMQKFSKSNEENNDYSKELLSYAMCLAAALEDFLI
ncbi:hypothetical protein SteCoe_3980 [Stentor coeruleus]|uniref:Uncharacterized protein n=1 Tax=Stentor coeruleus TaxID=5963 RepID=A0A1R2CVX5_9CILI|nr:hypothetical protein SteCoe_3980 [Stentor coeruleus]